MTLSYFGLVLYDNRIPTLFYRIIKFVRAILIDRNRLISVGFVCYVRYIGKHYVLSIL
jgi:hypothetical protein